MQTLLFEKGLKPTKVACTSSFRFGDGRKVEAVCSWTYPVGVYGTHGTLNIAEVAEDCPPLISLKQMQMLEIVLDFCKKTTIVQGQSRPMQTMGSGHPKINIDEFVPEKIKDFEPEFLIADENMSDDSVCGICKKKAEKSNWCVTHKAHYSRCMDFSFRTPL